MSDVDPELCYQRGSIAFPTIQWSYDAFAASWSSACVRDPALRGDEEDFLRLACIDGRPGAAEVFERQYFGTLREVIQRLCGNDDMTEMALQRLREKLLLPAASKLVAYSSSGSFRAWLRVVATRVALDTARQFGADPRVERDLSDRLQDLATSPEERVVRHDLRKLFASALRTAIQTLPERERQALHMHVALDWSVTQIGRAFRVHRATAARWLVSAKEQINRQLVSELEAKAQLESGDALGFFRDVRSRLDLSLSRIFETAEASDAG
jgi:RNA polymerase sigma-70 factor (ECF subfamily)